MMDERRKFPRHRVLKGATIAFDHCTGVSCMVRNLSDGGACIEMACVVGVPQNFMLVIDSDKGSRKSRVVWKTERRIGVSFR
jgi:hypothetical protein